MHLSRLHLDLRSAEVRRDLRSPWEMHRSLWNAYPGERDEDDGRILWRLDVARDGRPQVLVQSSELPDWNRLQAKYPRYLAAPAESKPISPRIAAGQWLRFRLRANTSVKRAGKRRSLTTPDDQAQWLARQGQRHGFDAVIERLDDEGTRRFRKGEAQASLCSVLFEGRLRVGDADAFAMALAGGIGHGKGLGLGLLSVGPSQ